jgi:leader peptidase (prepilin peptidase)/N-methyltransferase
MVLAYFSIVAVIDLEHRLILHPISLVGSILGIFIGVWLHGWLSTLIGGLIGFGIMLALFFIGVVFVRTIIRKRRPGFDEEPLGFGDVILSGILGLFVGWPGIVLCLIVGILIAGLGALIYILGRMVTHHYQSFDFVPYGPFLLAGAFILLFLRDHLVALASP